jgi:acyl carrier protein
MTQIHPISESRGTFQTISDILTSKFQVEPSLVTPETLLTELGIDSLSLMEFVFAVEDAFNLRIPEERLNPREAGIDLQKLSDVIDEFVLKSKI